MIEGDKMNQTNNLVQYRFKLKGKIHTAGYRTLSEFSRETGVDISRLSKIINGWELPNLHIEESISSALGISVEKLRDFL